MLMHWLECAVLKSKTDDNNEQIFVRYLFVYHAVWLFD